MYKFSMSHSPGIRVILLLMIGLMLAGIAPAPAKSQGTGHWYTNKNCEFSVKFPVKPQYRNLHTPDGFQVQQAFVFLPGDFFLRAECSDYGGVWDGKEIAARDEDWTGWMGDFMAVEGMVNPHIWIDKATAQGKHLVLANGRGNKLISGIWVTYRFRLIAGDTSILILSMGGPSSGFPTKEVTDFLEGYK